MSDIDTLKAWNTALRILRTSSQSQAKITEKLSAKGYDAAVVSETVSKLIAAGYLNDRRFAADLINRYTVIKPCGRRRIEFELKKRKISQAVIRDCSGALSEEAELERALDIARRKWESSQKLEIRKRRKKLYDFLLRRGFDFGTAQSCLGRITSAENEGYDDIESIHNDEN